MKPLEIKDYETYRATLSPLQGCCGQREVTEQDATRRYIAYLRSMLSSAVVASNKVLENDIKGKLVYFLSQSGLV